MKIDRPRMLHIPMTEREYDALKTTIEHRGGVFTTEVRRILLFSVQYDFAELHEKYKRHEEEQEARRRDAGLL